MAAQLESIERGLLELKESSRLPTPGDMAAMNYLRARLPLVVTLCATLEPELSGRVKAWKETPWTPRQRLIRNIASFIGWWIAGTSVLSYSILGWFAGVFPKPWYVLTISGGVAFIIILYVRIAERAEK